MTHVAKFPEGLVLLLLFLTFSSPCVAATQVSIEGVWKIEEVVDKGPEGESKDTEPQPSLVIFTRRHYSMMYYESEEKLRTDFADNLNPTDEEKVAAFDSIVMNSGTYELKGVNMTIRPIVARWPAFAGGYAKFEIRVEGDTLWLNWVDERYRDGTQEPWFEDHRTVFKLSRLE